MEWSQVPKFWQQLKYLRIWGCISGLTMAIFAEIVPQLKSLQDLDLPSSATRKEDDHFHEIVRDFSSRIRIRDNTVRSVYYWSCPFQKRNLL